MLWNQVFSIAGIQLLQSFSAHNQRYFFDNLWKRVIVDYDNEETEAKNSLSVYHKFAPARPFVVTPILLSAPDY